MTDLPNSAADPAANASIPDGETPAGDPELAALVRRGAPRVDAEHSPADVTIAEASASGEPTDIASADTSPILEPGVDAVPTLPVVAAVTDDEPTGTASAPTVARPPLRRLVRPGRPARRRHRRRRPVRMGPAVRRPGPARRPHRQHGPRRAHPRAGGRRRSRTPTGGSAPGRSRSPARTARRRPSATPTSAAAPTPRRCSTRHSRLAARASPLANLIGAPRAAIDGVTLDAAVAYDRDKLAAAVADLAATIDEAPVDAAVSAGEGGTFSVSPAKDGRAVDQAALLAALDQQLAALGTPDSIAMAVPVVLVVARRRHRLGRGRQGGRGSDGGRRGHRPGRGQLDDQPARASRR